MVVIFGTFIFFTLLIVDMVLMIMAEYSETRRERENLRNIRELRDMVDTIIYLHDQYGYSRDDIDKMLSDYGFKDIFGE